MIRTKRAPRLRDVVLALAVAGCVAACAAKSPEEPEVLGAVAAEVTRSRFGVVVPGPEGATLVGTRVVPLLPGTTLGWGLLMPDAPEEIEFREVYTLPAPPREVMGGASQREATVVEREARGTDDAGWLVGYWTLDEGDPPGRHLIDVYVGSERIYTFEFDVLIPRLPEPEPEPAP